MSKRRLILGLIGFGVLVVVGLLVCAVFREREPEYGGKRLSEWVRGYALATWEDYPLSEKQKIQDAVRHVCTDGIPYLLNWLDYEPPSWKSKLYVTVQKMRLDWVPRDKKMVRAEGAVMAFGALGREAKGAIPELTRRLNDAGRSFHTVRALHALGHIGTAGLPPLLEVLTNQQTWLRWSVVSQIGEMGTGALPAVTTLQNLLNHPDPNLREAVTNALRKIDPKALESPLQQGRIEPFQG